MNAAIHVVNGITRNGGFFFPRSESHMKQYAVSRTMKIFFFAIAIMVMLTFVGCGDSERGMTEVVEDPGETKLDVPDQPTDSLATPTMYEENKPVISVNLIVDLLYHVVDPRLRFDKAMVAGH